MAPCWCWVGSGVVNGTGDLAHHVLLAIGIKAHQCWGRVEREPKQALGGRGHVTRCKRSSNHPRGRFSTCTRVLAEWLCSRKMYTSVQHAPPHQYMYLPFSPVLTCCLPLPALLSGACPCIPSRAPHPLHNNAMQELNSSEDVWIQAPRPSENVWVSRSYLQAPASWQGTPLEGKAWKGLPWNAFLSNHALHKQLNTALPAWPAISACLNPPALRASYCLCAEPGYCGARCTAFTSNKTSHK